MYKRILFLAVFSIIVLVTSCDIINPEEETPAYISVESFMLTENNSVSTSTNHNITDVWISVNGDFIGVYELPALFPVLEEGIVSVYVKAGIKNNGIAASRESYPFYTPYEADIELIPGETFSLSPVVSYYEETIFDEDEDFEGVGVILDTTIVSLAALEDTFANNSQCGLVNLNSIYTAFRAETIDSYSFPETNTTLYLELDYIANNSFVVGLLISSLGQVTEQPVISINPIDSWNKIYLDLSYYSATYNYADHYRVYIAAAKNDSIPNAVIMFDNLKLVHF